MDPRHERQNQRRTSRLCWWTSNIVFFFFYILLHPTRVFRHYWYHHPGLLWLVHDHTVLNTELLPGPVSTDSAWHLTSRCIFFSIQSSLTLFLAKDLFFRTSATWHHWCSGYRYATPLYWTMPAFCLQCFFVLLSQIDSLSWSLSACKINFVTCFHCKSRF